MVPHWRIKHPLHRNVNREEGAVTQQGAALTLGPYARDRTPSCYQRHPLFFSRNCQGSTEYNPGQLPNFWLARRLPMQQYFVAAIWCMFLMTGIAAYIPLMYIRKTDKILKLLQQIEANTSRKP
jgi:hypothetical protein